MSTLSIIPYQFEDKPIRAALDENGEPLFVANDVCKILGIADPKQAIERLDDDERRGYDIPTGGGIQFMSCITEAGLYRLLFTSRKPEAERIKRWIAHDVLPSIRKTGSYAIALTPAQQILMIAQHMVDLEQQAKQTQLVLEVQNNRLDKVEARQDVVDHFYTVIAWANLAKRHPNKSDCQKIGRWASKYSKSHNYNIGQVKHELHGHINSYHEDVLKLAFEYWFTQNPLFNGDY